MARVSGHRRPVESMRPPAQWVGGTAFLGTGNLFRSKLDKPGTPTTATRQAKHAARHFAPNSVGAVVHEIKKEVDKRHLPQGAAQAMIASAIQESQGEVHGKYAALDPNN